MRWLVIVPLVACGAPHGQHEITASGDLLTADGKLREPGWERRPLLAWDPSHVHDPAKLRQWDFFSIVDENAAVNVTLGDVGLELGSVGVVEMNGGRTQTSLGLGNPGDLTLSTAPFGATTFQQAITYQPSGDDLIITVNQPSPVIGVAASGTLTIHRRPGQLWLGVATPFNDSPYYFFYEQKAPGLTADGSITIGDTTYTFAGATAVLDWGRGEWPRYVTWRWASGSGTIGGQPFAFNLGEGFGNDAAATENVFFYGDQVVKLGRVTWTFDRMNPTGTWTFRDADGLLDLTLQPLAPETSDLELGAHTAQLVKAYGHLSGTVEVGGRAVAIDGILGAAEEENISW